jgi:hypothetical protein
MSNNNPNLRTTAIELLKRFVEFNQSFKNENILNGRYRLIENENVVCEKFQARDQLENFKMYDFSV